MPVRLIAMDMDGTLLLPSPAPEAPISRTVLDALHDAADAGIVLALATGRIPDDAGFFALDAGLSMRILALNGACCLDEPMGDIVSQHFLPADETLSLLQLLDASGVQYGIFSGHELIVSAPEVTEEELSLHWGSYLTRPGGRTRVHAGARDAQACVRRGANKLLVLSEDEKALSQLARAIASRCPGIDVSSSWHNNLELNPRGVNKGTALTELAARLGIPMSQVMAIGDQSNDLPMLRVAHYSVAMGNSTRPVLDHARYRTRSNAEDGVACAIRALALGQETEGVFCIR